MKKIAITAKSNKEVLSSPVTPCGACRQVMSEYERIQSENMEVILKGEKFGPWETETSVPCLYLDGEMAAQDMQYRAMELEMGNGSKRCDKS